MVLIPLRGKVAAGRCTSVADDVAGEVLKHRWHCDGEGYACRNVYCGRQDGKQKNLRIWMHCEVVRLHGTEISDGQEVDHINGDKLDNRWPENLRVATRSQNTANSKPHTGTSRYKGVSWNKRDRRWKAQIRHNGKLLYLGYFTDQIEAAKAYDTAALRLHGEYARCNFPQGDTNEQVQ